MNKIRCPYCGSGKVQRRGNKPKQRYMCSDEKHPDNTSRYFYFEKAAGRILLFDIETLPLKLFGWRLWDKITDPGMIIQDRAVLSYAAKWLFEPKHESAILSPKDAVSYNDESLVKRIWKLFDAADVIIAHYGDHFDVPLMNTRFLYYGLDRPRPYVTIDTKDTASRTFAFTSDKLDYLGEYLGLGRKHKTEFQLWKDCAAGNPKALDIMHKYNQRDIYLLEDVYVRLRPYIKHPNMSLYMDVPKGTKVCTRCGHDELEDLGLAYRTEAGVYKSYRCENCGGISRVTERSFTTATRSV